MRITKIVPAVLILVMASCATDEFAHLKADVSELKKVQYQQKDDVADIKSRLSISDTQKGKSDTLNAIRDSQENLNSKATNLSRELQQLYGRVEERKFYVDHALAEAKAERDLLKTQLEMVTSEIGDLRGRVERVEAALQKKGIAISRPDPVPSQKPPVTASKEPPTDAPPPPPSPEPLPVQQTSPKAQQTSPKAMYDEAMKEFNSGKYKESREKFNRISKEFPTSSLAASGNFWIGESYFKEGSYEDAILSYDIVVKKYPNSDKVPAAKLKQALAFIEIKDPKPARTILQQIVDDYPHTPEAEQAKKQLQLIGNQPTTKTDTKKKATSR
ncbi:MAG: tol-pal system protein YbgF [Nitrospirae bacterium]|nr:tol-pal system protein YbgF [Nitrospirota bacterium]